MQQYIIHSFQRILPNVLEKITYVNGFMGKMEHLSNITLIPLNKFV